MKGEKYLIRCTVCITVMVVSLGYKIFFVPCHQLVQSIFKITDGRRGLVFVFVTQPTHNIPCCLWNGRRLWVLLPSKKDVIFSCIPCIFTGTLSEVLP